MFVAPENQQPEVPKPQGFIAPENSSQAAPPLAQDKQPEGLAAQLVSKAGQAALAPITAISKPIAEAISGFIAPENDPNSQAHTNPLEFERSSNYPGPGVTGLGPTLDVMFAAQGAKDIASLAGKGIAKGVTNVVKNRAEKSAIKDFIKSPKAVEGIPTSPIELPTAPKSAVGPEIGVTTNKPQIEVYVKGKMGGGISPNTGKPLPEVKIYGVKGDPDVLLKEFGDKAPASVPEEVLKSKGLLPGEVSKPPVTPTQLEFPKPQPKSKGIEFNKRQTGEIEKALGKPLQTKEQVLDEATGIRPLPEGFGTPEVRPASTPEFGVPKEAPQAIKRMALDEMKEPIQPPTKPDLRLLPGGKQRVQAFSDLANTEISARNPLTSRAELNKKLGTAEDVATKQWLEGVKAENKAVENAIQDKASLYKTTTVRPDTLESEALFRYIEHPNKMEAYGRLAQATGTEKADEIVKAADNMRKTYDKLLPEVNKVRAANGEAPIKYRQNYITHANEMNILSDLGKLDLIDTPEGKQIVDGVMGANEQLASKSPNLYSKLKEVIFPYTVRKGGETSLDAVSNFNRYVDTAHRYIQTQPYVNELLDTAKALESKAPNVANYLKQQANFIAGGKSILDKGIEAIVDKDLLKIAQQLQNNAKGNVISLNPSVPVTQLFGLVPTAGKYPLKASLSATINSFANPEFEKYILSNVPVLQSRALGAAENDLMLGPVSKQSARITNWFDYKVAEISAMAAYKNAIAQGKSVAEALQEANSWAAISQAHLGKVSTPPMMQSKNVQAVLPLMNQQIAYGRSILLHTLQGKTITEKTLAATKMLIFGSAVAAIKSAVTGHPDHPLSPTNILPFGGVLEHGAGGPLLNQASRLATAKSQEDFVRQLIRTGFLLQNKIPGGAIVGKQVENFFMGKKKKGK